MNTSNFSNWFKWEDRDTANGVEFPGIYIIVVTTNNIEDTIFKWIPEIAYIGMTNSLGGLKSRLKQFDYTIFGKRSVHGGADRFRFKYENYNDLIESLYVAVIPFKCSVKDNTPKDLRVMGEVSKFEYDCFAEYKELYNELPEFNEKKKSLKYSLTHRNSKNS